MVLAYSPRWLDEFYRFRGTDLIERVGKLSEALVASWVKADCPSSLDAKSRQANDSLVEDRSLLWRFLQRFPMSLNSRRSTTELEISF